jgi:hypothetical protein
VGCDLPSDDERVQVRLDRIDVDVSAERLVERLLETNNSPPGMGDSMARRAEDGHAPAEPVVRLTLPAQLKRTGKEMKFVVDGEGDERTADPAWFGLSSGRIGSPGASPKIRALRLKTSRPVKAWAGLTPLV